VPDISWCGRWGGCCCTISDLDELRAGAVDAFTARLRSEPLREFYARPRDGGRTPQKDPAKAYFATAIARLHAAHVLLFHIGCSTSARSSGPDRPRRRERLGRAPRPGRGAVPDRYLRLHLDANLDRPQTVRHARDALRGEHRVLEESAAHRLMPKPRWRTRSR
jgi:hypothetical protein